MAVINYRDGRPIYEQIADYYRKLILCGVLSADEQLPSVRSLAMELSTNPNTIQKAYAELLREGFCYTVKGLGNFVADNTALREGYRKELVQRLSDLYAEGEAVGLPMDALWEEAAQAAKTADRKGIQND